jgi:hypothetical protein
MCVVVSISPMYLELSHFDIGTHLTACHFIFPPFYWHIDYYTIYLPLEFVPDKKHVLVYIRRKTYLYLQTLLEHNNLSLCFISNL